MKNFSKSANIWKSYERKISLVFFWFTVCLKWWLISATDDGEVEEEEMSGIVDESSEQEFSFKDFVLR